MIPVTYYLLYRLLFIKMIRLNFRFCFYLCISLLSILCFTRCKKESAPAIVNTNPPTSSGNDSTYILKTYLALGDSYTIGQSVTIADRFPAQTTALLKSSGVNMADPKYIATSGWRTDDLYAAMINQHPSGQFDVVSLLIGVNDQYQRRDTTGYRDRFRQILIKSISLAGNKRNHVFVLSIPDYSVTPFAANADTAFIRTQIDQFNKINREVTIFESCNYLDITSSTREAAFDLSLIASDGLHPSGKEYGKWAGWLAPMMRTVLR